MFKLHANSGKLLPIQQEKAGLKKAGTDLGSQRHAKGKSKQHHLIHLRLVWPVISQEQSREAGYNSKM